MKRKAPIPPEMSSLGISYVQRVNNNELSSSCPKCGGSQHQNGEWPDRFRIWYKSANTGGLAGWCRRCGYWWTPKGERLDPEKHQQWIKERKVREENKRVSAEHALELLRKEQRWLVYHELLTDSLIAKYYEPRLLSAYWVYYWSLGYNPRFKVWDRALQEEYITPSLTIPVFNPVRGGVTTIRHRLIHPKKPEDKYRPERTGLPSGLFFANKDAKPIGQVLLVEGEFKAMTTHVVMEEEVFVVGIPGKRPTESMFDDLQECDQVYICLDPDAYITTKGEGESPIRRLIKLFGNRARVISIPYKIDDMIMDGSLDKDSINVLMKDARKIRVKNA